MGKILCCWELGEDYGHIGQFLALINRLTAEGHDIYFAAKDLSKIGEFEWPAGVHFLQAPLWLARPKKPLKAESFAEIILHKGFDSLVHLRVLANAWRRIIDWVSPDVLILDHSPTALLASRGAGIPRIIFTNPFVSPPPGSPPVNLRPWEEFNQAKAMNIENQVLAVMNQFCVESGMPALQCVSDLFAVEKTFLSGCSELDHYRHCRSLAIYGNSSAPGKGLQKPVWSPGTSMKVFAYLKMGRDQVGQVLHCLSRLQARVVCFFAGAGQEDIDRFSGSSLVVSNKPFDVLSVCREAQVVISHGGMGMVQTSIYAGLPMILLPTQIEQQNTAIRLEKLGVATVIEKQDSPMDVNDKLTAFFGNPLLFENAKSFAEKVKLTTSADILGGICEACENLIHQS